MSSSLAVKLQAHQVPSLHDAVTAFEGEGGALSRPTPFGSDPAEGNAAVQSQRETLFEHRYGDLGDVLSATVNGNWQPMHDAFRFFHYLVQTM